MITSLLKNQTLKEQQKLQNEISKLTTETSELTIQEQIVQLYVQIMYTREAVKVNEELAKVAEAQYNRGVQMQKQGQMAHADVVKLEAQLQDARYDIINSKTQVDNYKRQLKNLLQLDINTDFDVTGEIPSDDKPLEMIPAAGEVYARALTTRPEIESAHKGIANAELQYDIAKRGYYPTISVNASVSDGHNSNSSFSYGDQFKGNLGLGAGVSVSVPIWDARKTRTAKEKALLSKQTAELELENRKNALSSSIEALWLNANNGQQKFIAAETKGKSQKESYILTNQQFQHGLKNVVDVLQSRSLVLQAAQDKLQSKYMTLMNMQLLKRLESSVNSFRLTLTRIRDYMQETLDAIARFQNGERRVSVDDYESVDGDEDEQDFTIGKKKNRILLEDMDYISWQKEIKDDLEIIRLLLLMLQSITPEHDSKLQQLIIDLQDKFAHPINGSNKKVLVFTAFSDTAQYLYDCLADPIKKQYGLNVALVTGDVEARSTLKLKEKLDFNKVLTLFSPISKEREAVYPHLKEEIDVLIATDCISEGQNLQDCDYLLNYDIHWNPVRIIQRFGRIDRIGSKNAQIQLVNYWPDMTLDEYINLKGRVESRMKVTVMTATGDDNLLSPEEKDDLEYRKQQLERLKEDVVDLEEMNTGVSIMDLGLNEFRLDLLEYINSNHDVEHTPFGLHAVVPATDQAPAGTVFVLKNRTAGVNIDHKNQLHPFYMVYVKDDGEVLVDHLHPKDLLDKIRLLCKPMTKPDVKLCSAFNKETRDGLRMGKYSDLLSKAIESVVTKKDESDMDSFLEGFAGELFEDRVTGLDDFELICFLVIK